MFIDEWQRYAPVWDAVRRAVDDRAGQFLLAGSAVPLDATIHSGAGRIGRVRMRPMGLAERGLASPTVSLTGLLSGDRVDVAGSCDLGLADYAEQVVASGFPGIRGRPDRERDFMLGGYLSGVVERDFESQGRALRRPTALRQWLTAYAAASASTASYNSLLVAATPGEADKPSRGTAAEYRDVLDGLYLLDPLPGWVPVSGGLQRLMQAPKHHLSDPALAVRLLNADVSSLLSGKARQTRNESSLLGALFESLVTLTVRTLAQRSRAQTFHLRTRAGEHEVDIIVEGPQRRVLAIEVKLGVDVGTDDVRHLTWLRDRLGDELLDAVVITTGPHAYRRRDGIAVVPAALLGP